MKYFFLFLMIFATACGIPQPRRGEDFGSAYRRSMTYKSAAYRRSTTPYATSPSVGLVDGPAVVCRGRHNPLCLAIANKSPEHFMRCWKNSQELVPSTRFGTHLRMPVQVCGGKIVPLAVVPPRGRVFAMMHQPHQHIYCEFYSDAGGTLQVTTASEVTFRRNSTGEKYLWMKAGRDEVESPPSGCTNRL